MTREELIKAIYDSPGAWSCRNSNGIVVHSCYVLSECEKCAEYLLTEYENSIRANERVGIIEEVDMHLREAEYIYDSNMGIGDNIGSALLKEYVKGYKKGEQDGGEDAIRKFAEWLVNKGALCSRVIANGEITDYGKVYVSEYEKQMKGETK